MLMIRALFLVFFGGALVGCEPPTWVPDAILTLADRLGAQIITCPHTDFPPVSAVAGVAYVACPGPRGATIATVTKTGKQLHYVSASMPNDQSDYSIKIGMNHLMLTSVSAAFHRFDSTLNELKTHILIIETRSKRIVLNEVLQGIFEPVCVCTLNGSAYSILKHIETSIGPPKIETKKLKLIVKSLSEQSSWRYIDQGVNLAVELGHLQTGFLGEGHRLFYIGKQRNSLSEYGFIGDRAEDILFSLDLSGTIQGKHSTPEMVSNLTKIIAPAAHLAVKQHAYTNAIFARHRVESIHCRNNSPSRKCLVAASVDILVATENQRRQGKYFRMLALWQADKNRISLLSGEKDLNLFYRLLSFDGETLILERVRRPNEIAIEFWHLRSP